VPIAQQVLRVDGIESLIVIQARRRLVELVQPQEATRIRPMIGSQAPSRRPSGANLSRLVLGTGKHHIK
jgi:hypothetical protein